MTSLARRPVIHFTAAERYPAAPYHPAEPYAELGPFAREVDPTNHVYGGVRRVLMALGYDAARRGTPQWSPLSDLVAPGGTVVLKPNFVRHYNEDPAEDLESVVTHPSLLRPLIDYALKAVGDSGKVIVADAPQYDCDVDLLLERNHLPQLLAWYAEQFSTSVEFRDLRVQFGTHDNGIVTERRDLPGDPEGYEAVDLGAASEFTSLGEAHLRLLRGADYDEQVTGVHHSRGRNEYLVARTVLNADLVINCPKIKTHKKAGVTLSMKNLIGINGDKNWLPHYRAGFGASGGDEFPRPDAYSRFRRFGGEIARRLLKRGIGGAVFRRIRAAENAAGLGERSRAGNWYGNDTIWRTCLDLNKIFYLGDETGKITGEPPRRRTLNIYDGIVAGEGKGPMGPRGRPIGLVAGCEDGGAIDVVLTWIMGFDWRRVPVITHALQDLAGGVRISDFRGDPETLPVAWIDAKGEREVRLSEIDLDLRFEAHPGWAGRIEREGNVATCAS